MREAHPGTCKCLSTTATVDTATNEYGFSRDHWPKFVEFVFIIGLASFGMIEWRRKLGISVLPETKGITLEEMQKKLAIK